MVQVVAQTHALHSGLGLFLDFRIDIDGLVPAEPVDVVDAVPGQPLHGRVPYREPDKRRFAGAMTNGDSVAQCLYQRRFEFEAFP
jgi:hypothetical protein